MTGMDAAATRASQSLVEYVRTGRVLADTIEPLLVRPRNWRGVEREPALALLLGPLRTTGADTAGGAADAGGAVERLGPLLGRAEAWFDAQRGAASAIAELRDTVAAASRDAGISTHGTETVWRAARLDFAAPSLPPDLTSRLVEGSGRSRRLELVAASSRELVASWKQNALLDLQGTGTNGPVGKLWVSPARVSGDEARRFLDLAGQPVRLSDPGFSDARLTLNQTAALLQDLAAGAAGAADRVDVSAPLEIARRAATLIPEQAVFDQRMREIADILG